MSSAARSAASAGLDIREYRESDYLVVATNTRAIRLWERLGFSVVGRLPGAFNHQQPGYVDALVMFKTLVAGNSPGGRTP